MTERSTDTIPMLEALMAEADQPSTATAKNLNIARAVAEAAADRKGGDIVILDVADVAYLADFFIIVSGLSPVQVKAIANAISATLETDFGLMPRHIEGMSEGRWVLQDYGDVVIHCFMPEEREFYNLEAFWGHGKRIDWEPEAHQSLA
jgi:ribosome-associated protein